MSTSFEAIRQAVISTFQSVHTAHSSLLVNYPNFVVVDIEHQTAPFISLHLDFPDTRRAAMGETELLVSGTLQVYFYYREGVGMAGAYSYTDMLTEQICMQQIGALYYGEIKINSIQSFPGWKGILNSIPFTVNSGLSCSS